MLPSKIPKAHSIISCSIWYTERSKTCCYIFFVCIQIRAIDTSKLELIVYQLLDRGTTKKKKKSRITAKIVIGQIQRSAPFQGPKLTSITFQLLKLIHVKVLNRFKKSKSTLIIHQLLKWRPREGQKLSLIVKGNLKKSDNNYKIFIIQIWIFKEPKLTSIVCYLLQLIPKKFHE